MGDGANRLGYIVGAATPDQSPALAVTNLNNLIGAVKFNQTRVAAVLGAAAETLTDGSRACYFSIAAPARFILPPAVVIGTLVV